jgi:hypothetical protein
MLLREITEKVAKDVVQELVTMVATKCSSVTISLKYQQQRAHCACVFILFEQFINVIIM